MCLQFTSMSLYSFVVLLLFSICSVVHCANILCVFSFPSLSHQRFFQPIWKALALRGHQVVVITPNPLKDKTLTNLTEIDVSFSYEVLKNNRLQDDMAGKNIIGQYNAIMNLGWHILEDQMSSPEARKIFQDESRHFDVILMESFFPMLHALGNKYNAPVISVVSLSKMLFHDSLAIGNTIHPVLNPDFMLGLPAQMTISEKISSTFYTLMMTYNYYYNIIPMSQKIAERLFGVVPDLYEAVRNVSLVLSAVNYVLYPVIPSVPASVGVSLLHIQEPKQLPQKGHNVFLAASDLSPHSLTDVDSMSRTLYESVCHRFEQRWCQMLPQSGAVAFVAKTITAYTSQLIVYRCACLGYRVLMSQ